MPRLHTLYSSTRRLVHAWSYRVESHLEKPLAVVYISIDPVNCDSSTAVPGTYRQNVSIWLLQRNTRWVLDIYIPRIYSCNTSYAVYITSYIIQVCMYSYYFVRIGCGNAVINRARAIITVAGTLVLMTLLLLWCSCCGVEWVVLALDNYYESAQQSSTKVTCDVGGYSYEYIVICLNRVPSGYHKKYCYGHFEVANFQQQSTVHTSRRSRTQE